MDDMENAQDHQRRRLQQFVLRQSREALRGCLRLAHLLPLLELKGLLDEDEVNIITGRSTEEEQVDELVRIFLNDRKSCEQYEEFRQSVILSRQESIVNTYLCDEACERYVLQLQKKLSKYLLENFSQVDMLTADQEGRRVPLDMIYVDTRLAIYSKKPSGYEKEELASLSHLFSQEQLSHKRVLVRGIPMAGKSTLVKKLTFDWARSIKMVNDPESTLEDVPEIGRFKLVMLILLRYLGDRQQATAVEVMLERLKDYVFISDQDERTIQWLLQDDPSKVLWLLDGFDEMGDIPIHSIKRLINGAEYQESMCVITSRTEELTSNNFTGNVLQVSMEGFSEDQRKEYIQKYMASCKQISREKSQPMFEGSIGTFSNPGWLEIECLLWERTKQKSSRKEQLFKNFIRWCFLHAERREDWDEEAFQRELPHESKLLNFGQLALRGRSNKMKIIFTKNDVFEVVGTDAMKYGLLYKATPMDPCTSDRISFVHIAIQEWLAANYLHYLQETNRRIPEEYIYYTSLHAFISDSSFHQMLYSFSSSLVKHVFKHFTRSFDQAVSENDRTFLDAFLLWSRNTSVSGDIFQCLEGTKFEREIKGVSFYFCDNLQSHGTAIGFMMKALSNCKSWNLSKHKINAETIKEIVRVLPDANEQVEELELSHNNLAGGGEAVGHLLTSVQGLKKLDLCKCGFSKDDLEHFVHASEDALSQVESFKYSENELQGTGKIFGELLLKLTACTRMNLSPTSSKSKHQIFTAEDWEEMASVLGERTIPIETLGIKEQTFKGAGKSLGRLMACMPEQKTWYLFNQNLDKADYEAMLKGLNGRKVKAEKVWLQSKFEKKKPKFEKKSSLTGSGRSLGQLMVLMPCVSVWSLRNLGLNTDDVEQMAHQSPGHFQNINVKSFDISSNKIEGRGAALGRIISHFSQCSRLSLAMCRLNADDLAALVQAMENNMANVEDIDISKNKFHRCGKVLARLLTISMHCRYANIGSCKLKRVDINEIVLSIGNSQISMETLILGGNDLHGCMSTLGRLLQQAPNCSKLGIRGCNLSSTDLSNLAAMYPSRTFQAN